MQKVFLILMLAISLVGCESAQEKSDREQTERLAAQWDIKQNNALPANWQALIKKHMRQILKDPDSAQYKFLGEPVKQKVDGVELWILGVDINAKNDFGGYTGYQVWTVSINKGEVAAGRMTDEQSKFYREIMQRK